MTKWVSGKKKRHQAEKGDLCSDQSPAKSATAPLLGETKTLPRAMTRCIVHGREPLEIHSVRNAAEQPGGNPSSNARTCASAGGVASTM